MPKLGFVNNLQFLSKIVNCREFTTITTIIKNENKTLHDTAGTDCCFSLASAVAKRRTHTNATESKSNQITFTAK